jgi:4-hydroxy-3-methylbut-2-enyl diphosphate reductase IspH
VSANTVGLTAGTSTPDSVIDEVEKHIHELTTDFCARSLKPNTIQLNTSK